MISLKLQFESTRVDSNQPGLEAVCEWGEILHNIDNIDNVDNIDNIDNIDMV